MLTPVKSIPEISGDVVKILITHRLSVEQYLILSTLHTKRYDVFLDYIRVFPIGTEAYQYLHRLELLTKEDEVPYSIFTVSLTEKANKVFESSEEDSDAWIDEWRELWPKGVTSGGYPVRADMPSIKKKMKAFIKKYNYDKDTIFSITKKYLEDKRLQNYSYIKTAA